MKISYEEFSREEKGSPQRKHNAGNWYEKYGSNIMSQAIFQSQFKSTKIRD